MIVVDTNVIAYLYLSSEHSDAAGALLARDNNWVAPMLWRSEFRNILALYLRKNVLALPDALVIMQEAERLMAGGEYETASVRVLTLAAESGCSAYDCEFVAVAKDLGVGLVAEDKALLRAFPAVARPLAAC